MSNDQLFTKQDMATAFKHGKYDMTRAAFLAWLCDKEKERRRFL